MSEILAIIPAGGIGKRMKSQKPKQFMTLDDEPIIAITIRALASTGLVNKFIVPTVDLIYTRKILQDRHPELEILVCKGCKTRQDSIYNGLDCMKEAGWDPDYILVHDAVRALLRKSTVERVINKAKETGAAIVARPVVDSLKLGHPEADSNIVKKTVSRDHLWYTQTPQVFKAETMIAAYERAREDHFQGTDSAGLVERLQQEIHIVEGYPSNIKITTSEDLELAKLYFQLGLE
ncbi:MAG: 2-C-methyl-D-erythritol 4-phosphate cytidylyltransferase [Candidatus Melainabacteria bacterium]|nr:2-C-methyl-D-erythritol 4-phosphate cytidylyltransferase [Candidatus Melainabacteria bacterium]